MSVTGMVYEKTSEYRQSVECAKREFEQAKVDVGNEIVARTVADLKQHAFPGNDGKIGMDEEIARMVLEDMFSAVEALLGFEIRIRR